jgi:transcriptional regulator with XRE-family HTH domain
MTLDEYLRGQGLTAFAFARLIGVSHVAVGRWIKQQRFPSAQSLRIIAEATEGKVMPNDFLFVPKPPKRTGRFRTHIDRNGTGVKGLQK